MLECKEISERAQWESYLQNPYLTFYPFFQSWDWGEVQKGLGFEITRFGLYDGGKLVGVCQIIDVFARRGHYLHLRHGPLLFPFDAENFTFIIDEIKKIAKEKKASFIRMSPLVEDQFIDKKMLRKMGFRNSPIHRMDAEVCWILNITKSDQELLAGMRKSHRYLIRKGLSDANLQIVQSTDPSDIEKFIPLYKHLSQRKHFVPHRGISEEFKIFGKENNEVLFLAEYQNQIIAGALIAFVGNTAIYRHSASDENFRNIPAMHVIQWHAILEAKKRGLQLYNFWGIAEGAGPKHPWSGLTLFKTGFGGEKKEFLRAQDLPLSKKYWKTHLIDRVTKKLKGY